MSVGYEIAQRFGLVWGFTLSVILIGYFYFLSDQNILKKLKAQRLQGQDSRSLNLFLKRLCKKANLSLPKIYSMPSASPSSFVLGQGQKGTIILSQGLLNQFDHKQLEAILAFHLAQIKRGDAMAISMGCATTSLLTFWNKKGHFKWIPFSINKIVAYTLMGHKSHLRSDQMAKAWLSEPKSLATALIHLESYFSTRPPGIFSPELSMGFPVNPLTKRDLGSYLQLHPELRHRVKSITGYFPI